MANETTQQTIEIKLGDGSVVKGSNMDEAFANLSEMKVNASRAIKETSDKYDAEKAEKERLATELETLKEENERIKNADKHKIENTSTDGKGFNRETYFQILGQDPIKANRYLLMHDLGLEKEDDVPQTFLSMREQIANVSRQVDVFTQQTMTAAFLAQNPDYPQGDVAAASKLSSKVDELIKQGIPYNATTIEFAYHQLVKANEIKPIDLNSKKDEDNKETANPSLSGSSQISEAEAQKAETMSDKDLYTLLQSKGMFR